MNTKISLNTYSLLGFILLSLSLLMPHNSQAQTNDVSETKPLKIYDVEIILFKNLNVPKGIEKVQPSQAPQLDKIFISLANQNDIDAAAKLGFNIPQDNEQRLLELVEKINVSSRYQLLTHMIWRQPGLNRDHAIAVQIRTGEIFSNDFSSIDNPVTPLLIDEKIDINAVDGLTILNPNQIEPNQTNLSQTDPNKIDLMLLDEIIEEPKPVWYELEGKITISLARYLHAKVDLVLRVPNENSIQFNDPIETNPAIEIPIDQSNDSAFDLSIEIPAEINLSSSTLNNYPLKEHRRMRSRKLHYLDHPEFGMLILITPYEEPIEVEFIEDINIL